MPPPPPTSSAIPLEELGHGSRNGFRKKPSESKLFSASPPQIPRRSLTFDPAGVSSPTAQSYAEHKGGSQWNKLFGDMERRHGEVQFLPIKDSAAAAVAAVEGSELPSHDRIGGPSVNGHYRYPNGSASAAASEPRPEEAEDEDDIKFVVDFGDINHGIGHVHSPTNSQALSLPSIDAWSRDYEHTPSETALSPRETQSPHFFTSDFALGKPILPLSIGRHSVERSQGLSLPEDDDDGDGDDDNDGSGSGSRRGGGASSSADGGSSGRHRNGRRRFSEADKDTAAVAAATDGSPDRAGGQRSRITAAARRVKQAELTKKLRRAVSKAAALSKFRAPPERRLKSASGHGLFPFIQDALFAPLFYFMRDEHGNRPAPIIFNAIQLAVSSASFERDHLADPTMTDAGAPRESIESQGWGGGGLLHHHHHHLSITIMIQYGDVKWVITRRLSDFLSLHTMLNLRKFQGRIPYVPPFPHQFNYALEKAHILRTTQERHRRINDAAAERRKAFEDYLISTLRHLNMRPCYELCAFLELSAVSIFKNVGWKGKEGFLDRKVERITGIFCTPRDLRRWNRQWVLVRDSYIAFCNHISDPYPSDVLLADSQFLIKYKKKKLTGHPLNIYRITLSTSNRVVQLRSDSERSINEWRNSIEKMRVASMWSQAHRYGSFAPIRDNSRVMWFIDAVDYFHALSEALSNAKESIYIAGWWLTPELHLRRPYAQNEEYRIDRLLKRKAEEGVDIYIVVFKEVTMSLTINSAYTKKKLQSLHKNIHVQRHPDHLAGGTMFWAHHEKICVIDNTFAFIGGLDLCWGRWDNHYHRLCDYHIPDQANEYPQHMENFFGQDYNNARIHDFAEVNKYYWTLIDRRTTPRMPWHDIHMGMIGQPARDIARHFIQRWNFIKSTKSMHRPQLPLLMPCGDYSNTRNDFQYRGTIRTQAIRSSAEWSMGIHRESSIYEAYCELIRNAKHFVYIENQFFVSCAKVDPNYTVKNRIAEAIVERIKRAHEVGQKFRIIVIIPLMPAFEGDVSGRGAATLRLVMHWQYQSMSRGEHSIEHQLKQAGINMSDYIGFFGLRTYDVIRRYADGYMGKLGPNAPLEPETWVQQQSGKSKLSPAEATGAAGLHVPPLLPLEGKVAEEPSLLQRPNATGFEWATSEYHDENASRSDGDSGSGRSRSIDSTTSKDSEEASPHHHPHQRRKRDILHAGKHSALARLIQGTEHIRHFTFSPSRHGGTFKSSYMPRRYRTDSVSGTEHDMDIDLQDVDNYKNAPTQSNKPPNTVPSRLFASGANGAASGGDVTGYQPTAGPDGHHHRRYPPTAAATANGARQQPQQRPPIAHTTQSLPLGLGEEPPSGTPPTAGPRTGTPESGSLPPLPTVTQVVTELVYVHCKLLIVDDQIVVLGSANINDRSMLGNRDSEIGMVLEDTDMVDTFMDGKPYKAAKFAYSLRAQLCREHLGAMEGTNQKDLVLEQFDGKPPVDMRMTQSDVEYIKHVNRTVIDPLSDEFAKLWWGVANTNAEVYRDVFHCIPDNNIRNYGQYHKFVPSPSVPRGHAVLEGTSIPEVLTKLKKVHGHLVPFPLNFLCEETLNAKLGDREMLVPDEVFI